MPMAFTRDQIGPMTRTVADCALMTRIVAGHDFRDSTSSRRPVPDYVAKLAGGVKGLRIAVPENYFYDPVEPEVQRLLETSLAVFRDLGADLVPVTIPSPELANPMTFVIILAETAAYHGPWPRDRSSVVTGKR